jgi:DNA-binding MarR family transcriptional regulator
VLSLVASVRLQPEVLRDVQGTRDQIGESVRAAGFPDVTQAHVSLFRYPGLDRTRPSQLAQELQISKQAINDLLRDLEHRGYLTREVDANDRRSRLIRLTTSGKQLERAIQQAARQADADLENRLGHARFEALRDGLTEAVTSAMPADM